MNEPYEPIADFDFLDDALAFARMKHDGGAKQYRVIEGQRRAWAVAFPRNLVGTDVCFADTIPTFLRRQAG